jgi:hypothetical protein
VKRGRGGSGVICASAHLRIYKPLLILVRFYFWVRSVDYLRDPPRKYPLWHARRSTQTKQAPSMCTAVSAATPVPSMLPRLRPGDCDANALERDKTLLSQLQDSSQQDAAVALVALHEHVSACERPPTASARSGGNKNRSAPSCSGVPDKKQRFASLTSPPVAPVPDPLSKLPKLTLPSHDDWFEGGHASVLVNEMRKVVCATGAISRLAAVSHERLLNIGGLAFVSTATVDVRVHRLPLSSGQRLYSVAISSGGFAIASLHITQEAQKDVYYHYTPNMLRRPNSTLSAQAPSLSEARFGHVLLSLPHGVVACGGNASARREAPLASCEFLPIPSPESLLKQIANVQTVRGNSRHDEGAEAWTRLPNMLKGRLGAAGCTTTTTTTTTTLTSSGGCVATLTGGAVSVCGRKVELTTSCEQLAFTANGLVDPAGWTEAPPLLCARMLHGAAQSHGIIYVVGGVTADQRVLDSVEALLPGAREWTRLPKLPLPLKNPSVMVCNGGGIFVSGGFGADGVANQTPLRLAISAARWEVL